MDKFGIFKLVNSFFNFYNQSKNQSDSSTESNSNPLDALLKNFSAPKQQVENDKEHKNNMPPKVPLQSQMLSTIAYHDQVVKRVKEKTTVKANSHNRY